MTYATIRVLRYGVPNPPLDLECMPKVLSYTLLGQAILSWKKPTYMGYSTVSESANILYSVSVCINGHAESLDTTSATLYKTIMQYDFYTYFYYVSISVNGTSSGKTFCRISPRDRFLGPREFKDLNCSGNSALATWNVDPYNLLGTLNSVTIWGFCLNGTKTKALQYFDFTSLGQDTISVPILDMGMEFICFFGGSYDGDYDGKYRQGLIIPTDVCNQHKDYQAPKDNSTYNLVAIECNGNHVTLSWNINIVCLDESADISITGTCSNYSIDQMFKETRTDSNGMVVFDVNINASGCFFQFNISSHLQEFSSRALTCSFINDGLKTDKYNLHMCNQGQMVNGTNNSSSNAREEPLEESSVSSAQSFIIITVACAVIIVTGTTALTIGICFTKILSTQITVEDKILNELFPSTTIKENEFLQNIAIDDSVSAITIIEHLTFPLVGTSSIVKSVSFEATSQQELSNHSSVTIELESVDQRKSKTECLFAPDEAFEKVIHTHIDLCEGLKYGTSHDNSSGSSVAANSINSSGTE